MTAPCYLNGVGVVCAAGSSPSELTARLRLGESGVVTTDRFSNGHPRPVGLANIALPSLCDYPAELRSRNNQLALLAALQLRDLVAAATDRYGATRVAVVVGTSTSGIGESETAVRSAATTGEFPDGYRFAQQELGSLSAFLSLALGVAGPSFVHSAACASGAKAIASAARLLRAGLADAVVTGAVDSLSGFTVAGFASLNLLSDARCNPFSANRDGINIGEAAALFLMTREPATVRLTGWGESSDGYHFSAPDPTGRGAATAVSMSLARAGINVRDVNYVNLHATGSRANDEMEGAVMHALLGADVPMSGTKPFTGHTLGAAGALEAAICWLTMQDDNAAGHLPPHLWDGVIDPAIAPLHHVSLNECLGQPPRVTLSTSFAFGGANAALVFGRD